MKTESPCFLVGSWRTWQLAQSLSMRTVNERTAAVCRMAEWAGTTPERATTAEIVAWLADGGDWLPRTRWTYHSALSAWFGWLHKQGHREDNPMQPVGRPRRPRSEPRPISSDNLRRLLTLPMRRRTRAMVLLAALQGLRVHEIAKIKGEHLDLLDRTMTVTGKGGVIATLPLHRLVVMHAALMPSKGYWFPSANGGHQRRESISNTIKSAMVRAGVSGSAHQLRHWFGSALVAADVDLRTTQELMRHQNLTSTAIYTLVSDERRANGIDRLNPFLVTSQTPQRGLISARNHADGFYDAP